MGALLILYMPKVDGLGHLKKGVHISGAKFHSISDVPPRLFSNISKFICNVNSAG